MYSIISIVAKFDQSSRYFHVTSFVLHYSIKLALHICSLRLLHIQTTSYACVLWKFTLCNMWRRPFPTTFHSNPLSIHTRRELAQCAFNPVWFFSFAVQTQSVRIECEFDTHPMPSADAPFDFLLALVLSASHFTLFLSTACCALLVALQMLCVLYHLPMTWKVPSTWDTFCVETLMTWKNK